MQLQPHQPRKFSFPMRSFGKTSVVKRSFQAAWFDKFPWIHYYEALDAALCHLCARAENGGKLMANCKDVAFVSKGFTNWKDATEGFRRLFNFKTLNFSGGCAPLTPCFPGGLCPPGPLSRTTQDYGATPLHLQTDFSTLNVIMTLTFESPP